MNNTNLISYVTISIADIVLATNYNRILNNTQIYPTSGHLSDVDNDRPYQDCVASNLHMSHQPRKKQTISEKPHGVTVNISPKQYLPALMSNQKCQHFHSIYP